MSQKAHLTEDRHTHTGAIVRIGNKFSHRFSTTSGVRQGCVLAPALFLVAIDWILGHLAPEVGITVTLQGITDAITSLILPMLMMPPSYV